MVFLWYPPWSTPSHLSPPAGDPSVAGSPLFATRRALPGPSCGGPAASALRAPWRMEAWNVAWNVCVNFSLTWYDYTNMWFILIYDVIYMWFIYVIYDVIHITYMWFVMWYYVIYDVIMPQHLIYVLMRLRCAIGKRWRVWVWHINPQSWMDDHPQIWLYMLYNPTLDPGTYDPLRLEGTCFINIEMHGNFHHIPWMACMMYYIFFISFSHQRLVWHQTRPFYGRVFDITTV